MKLWRPLLNGLGDGALAAGAAAFVLARSWERAALCDPAALPHFFGFALADRWLAFAPIGIAMALAVRVGLALLARLRGIAFLFALALSGGALAALALAHDTIVAAVQRVLPPLGDALARASAYATTQPNEALLACAGLAALLSALRFFIVRKRPERVRIAALALGMFAATAIALPIARERAHAPNAKSVLLVVLDTVAARHLASGGYARNTMPQLEALGARGVRFPNAYSAAPWTLPSHASLFTGRAPIAHGATQENVALTCSQTLAEILLSRGYRTFAAVGNAVVGPHSRLDRGFAQFLPTWRRDVVAATRGSEHANNVVLERFLAGLEGDERFFAFVNYIDAHSPYEPPPPHDRSYGAFPRRPVDQSWQHYYTGKSALGTLDFQELADLYDGELEKLALDLDGLIASLERAGRLDDTLVIITSDHGENLGDHLHLDHVFNLYDSLLHVPLVLLGAGAARGAVDTRVATSVDVFATALAAAGIAHERAGAEGQNLLAAPAPRGELTHEYYFPNQVLSVIKPADLVAAHGRLARHLRRLRALRGADGWKLIWASNGAHELYDLRSDPNETTNLAGREPARVAEMTQRLEQRLSEQRGSAFRFADEAAPIQSAGFEGIDEETRRNLETLGYVK